MKSLSILITEIYQTLGKQYHNLNERKSATKDYILTEISQWNIKKFNSGDIISFKPVEFNPSIDSPSFEVRLVHDSYDDYWELKFGNLNAATQDDQYKWDNNDPYKLQKALFLQKVILNEIVEFLKNSNIKGIKFTPYDEDGLESDRLSYFQNMYKKLNSKEFRVSNNDNTFYITKKV